MSKTPKYAPANEKGEKPYLVTQSKWGRTLTKVVYAENSADARYRAFGRQGVGEYIKGCRRALYEEVPDEPVS